MPIDPDRLCRCHGEPMYRTSQGHMCDVKRRVRGRAARARYRQTAHGKAKRQEAERHNAAKAARAGRRLWIGHRYVGMAPTVEVAQRIRAHILGRLHGFKQRFASGAEVESRPAGAVQA